MSIFQPNFSKPGPGVPKDAPPKKGFALFWEILREHTGELFKLNALFALCALPVEVLAWLALWLQGSVWFWPLLALSVLAALPLGPACTATCTLLIKLLRGEPGFLWHDFKKSFRENFRRTCVFGMACVAVLLVQLLAFSIVLTQNGTVSLWLLAMLFFAMLLFAICVPYYFVQAAYVDLSNEALIKNSVLLALGHLPRSLAGALLGGGLLVLQRVFFPFTLPLTLTFGYSIPLLITWMWGWPPVNKVFKIDETLRARAGKPA